MHTPYRPLWPYKFHHYHVKSRWKWTSVVSRAFMAGVASQAGDADSSRAPGLTSGFQGSMNVHRGALLLVPQWQCISYLVFYICIIFANFLSCANNSHLGFKIYNPFIMLYVNVTSTGLYQNDEFTQYHSHMISFTINTVNGIQNISLIVMPVTITILRENSMMP